MPEKSKRSSEGPRRSARATPRSPQSPGARAAHTKATHAKPAQSKPAQSKPAGAKPAGAKPAHAKSGSKPAHAKPAHAKPAQSKPAQSKPAGSRPAGAKSRKPGSRKPGAPRSRKPATATSQAASGPSSAPAGDRLQKVLSAAGLGSRRACEELITSGRVEVDRQTVTKLGVRVDPHQEIRVDGELLSLPKPVYYAVNKPPGVVSTHRDPAQRQRVIDLVPGDPKGLITVGRLDLGSEGLILVTNDGELANRLTHPRYGIQKTYRVQVVGCPERETLATLRRGIHLAEGMVHAEDVVLKSQRKQSAILEIVLDEGRNREIRRMLAKLGHKVIHLVRVAVGPVRLGDLPPGSYRPLTRQEVVALRRATQPQAD